MIYDTGTHEVCVPSAGLPEDYEVGSYKVSSQVVYGSLTSTQSSPTLYFIISPSTSSGSYRVVEYPSRAAWREELDEMGLRE